MALAGPHPWGYLLNPLCVSIHQVVEDVLVSWGSGDSMCPWTSYLTRCFITCVMQGEFFSLCSLTDGWNRPAGSGKTRIDCVWLIIVRSRQMKGKAESF